MEFKGPHVSVSGGVSLRPHGIIQHGDPDVDALDLGPTSGNVDWEQARQREKEEFASRQNRGPTIVMSTGYFRFGNTPPLNQPEWCARLACGTCYWNEIFDNWAQMQNNIPDHCQAKQSNPDCPLFKGRMRADYERRNCP